MKRLFSIRTIVQTIRKPRRRRAGNDRGVALVVVLLLAVALSAIGASLLMLANTETYASMNYRMMSQARYGAEAGVLRAANYLTQTYTSPGQAGDPLANYNMNASPVTYNGEPVVLSADPNKASNYPAAQVQSGFSTAAQGTLAAGQAVTYNVYATLISMRTITEYGALVPTIIQTWKLVGTGSLGATRPATVEVTSVLERQVTPAHSFGVFATAAGCGALTFTGGSSTDSYDSSSITMVNGQPQVQASGGGVGSNGNLNVSGGQTQINGSLSTPRTGVGNCKNGSVTAYSGGAAQVSEGIIQLPQSILYPAPSPPSPLPPTGTISWSGSDCAQLGLSGTTCAGSPGALTLDPLGGTVSFGDVFLNGGATIHLKAGVYNLNSITVNGGAKIIIDTGPVIFNVAGVGTNQPISFAGNSISNPTFDPTNFHILYGGTSTVSLSGSTDTALMLYAPLAPVDLTGGSHIYGSIVGNQVSENGGTHFHYDRRLKNDFLVAGAYMMSAFTWKKY